MEDESMHSQFEDGRAPVFGDEISNMCYVPHKMSRLMMANMICYDAAYSSQRDDNWPIERCLEWVEKRLQELDAANDEDFEVYFPGDYWMITRDADGIESQGCASSSFFDCQITMTQGCICVTSHAVMFICCADED